MSQSLPPDDEEDSFYDRFMEGELTTIETVLQIILVMVGGIVLLMFLYESIRSIWKSLFG